MLELSHCLACSSTAEGTQKYLYPSGNYSHDLNGNFILEENIIHFVKIIVHFIFIGFIVLFIHHLEVCFSFVVIHQS